MFSRNIAQRQQLISKAKRTFQTHGTKDSGFERMLAEKMNWTRGLINGGTLFAAFGVFNLLGYGAGMLMEESNHEYYFKYTANKRFFQPLRSMFASNNLLNVAWTAPVLIGGGMMLKGQVGALASTKIFGLALMASYFGITVFGSPTPLSKYALCHYMPLRIDSIEADGQMGADILAQSVIFITLAASGQWSLIGLLGLGTTAYYGPQGLIAPASAAAMAFALF